MVVVGNKAAGAAQGSEELSAAARSQGRPEGGSLQLLKACTTASSIDGKHTVCKGD